MQHKEPTSTALIHGQLQESFNTRVDLDNFIIESRAKELETIQGKTLEVNQLFKDVAELVDSQSSSIDSIVVNLQEAKQSVEKGTKQIEKADERSKNSICHLL